MANNNIKDIIDFLLRSINKIPIKLLEHNYLSLKYPKTKYSACK